MEFFIKIVLINLKKIGDFLQNIELKTFASNDVDN